MKTLKFKDREQEQEYLKLLTKDQRIAYYLRQALSEDQFWYY